MKYVNDPYLRKLFRHARFMAEPEGGEGAESGGDDGDKGGSGGGKGNEPSVEELKIQLAKVQAQADRYKTSIDNLTKKNGELTKQNRQHMSDEQRAAAEQEERDKEIEDLRREVRISKYSKRFVGLGLAESDADEMANLLPEIEDVDNFFSCLGKHIDGIKASAAEAAIQKLLKDRPGINAGNGEGKTSIADEKAVALAKSRGGSTSNEIADYYKI